MNRLAGLVGVALLAVAGSGCARLFARSLGPPLDVPPPPARVVPIESQPIVAGAPNVDDLPTRVPGPVTPKEESSATPATRSETPPPTRAEAPPEPAAVPAPTPALPPPTLQTTANPTEAEQRTKIAIERAKNGLMRIDYNRLSANAKSQFDIARRFVQQAEDAIKARNPVFAEQLADKAATLAALLQQR